MIWNIGDKKELFLELKSGLGNYHDILTTPKSSPEYPTIITVQNLPDIKENAPKAKISSLKWTKNGRRSVCGIFNTYTDKLTIVMYHKINIFFQRQENGSENDRKPEDLDQTISSIDFLSHFSRSAMCWMKQAFMIETSVT